MVYWRRDRLSRLGLLRVLRFEFFLGPVVEDEHRTLALRDHVLRDDALLHVGLRRKVVHYLEHRLLHDRAKAARAGLALDRLSRDFGDRVLLELELDAVVFEK